MGDRALSTVVSYVLVLGLVALLTSILFVSTSGIVENERQETTRSSLEVVGNGIAADVDAADRLVQSGDRPETVELSADLPDRVVGTGYEIEIERVGEDERYGITLRSVNPEVTVTVFVRTQTPIEETTVNGGDLETAYDAEQDALVVRNA